MAILLMFVFFPLANSYSVVGQLAAGTGCNYCIAQSCTPTVYPAKEFDAKRDQQELQYSMVGVGTDEDTLISVLTSRSDYQRLLIAEEYIRTGSTLLDDIAGDTSYKFLGILQALTKPLPVFYAEELHKAIRSKNHNVLIEILTSLSPCAIREISVIYRLIYRVSLSKEIENRTRSRFKSLMLALAKGDRDEGDDVDVGQATKDANTLISAGVNSWILGYSKFVEIFTTRSFTHLRATFDIYDDLRKSKDPNYLSIYKDIDYLFSNKLEEAYTAIVKNAVNPFGFFAQELESALSGFVMAYDSGKVIRILRGRCEIDLYSIQEAYLQIFKRPLISKVQEKTFGDFKKTLVAILKQ